MVYRNKKYVEIENLKNNLKKASQVVKKRTGLCIKNNLIAYFSLQGNRNLLTDYLYLVDCDYAFETDTHNIANTQIQNNRPKIVFSLKNKVFNKIKFDDYKFLKKYSDKNLNIYGISCGNLSLSYKVGKSDPLIKKIINSDSNKTGIELFPGSIDPINPDGLSVNNEIYYKTDEKYAFIISDSSCEIALSNKFKSTSFYKEGKLVIQNSKKYTVLDDKYKKIMLGIAIRDDMVFIYQFNKPHDYKDMFKYTDKMDIKDLIIFENYAGILDEEAGRFFINSLKNGREISEFE